MQGAEMLIPILVPLGAFLLIFGIFYLKTRENMAMIEKGLNPKQNAGRPAPFRSLKTGLLIIGAGIGLLIAYFIDRNLPAEHNEAVYFSLVAIGGGIGLIISYSLEKKEIQNRQEERKKREELESVD